MNKILPVVCGLVAVCLGLFTALPVKAASLQYVSGFGTFTPTNGDGPVTMYIYVPNNVVSNPPILVLIHYCGGSAAGVFGEASGGGIVSACDQYGFIMVVPQAVDNSTNARCWDPGSPSSLTRYGGGDTQAIINMVNYTITNYHANSNRVYVTGTSSGAMMTEALLALYPDVFKAGAEFSGVPAGGWAVSDPNGLWSAPCATGQVTNTPLGWGNIVRAMYPGYSGPRPRAQLWHGTADTIINFTNQLEAIKEWSNVLGLSTNPAATTTVTIGSVTNQWTHQNWQDGCGNTVLDAWSEINGPHGTDANLNAQYVIPFLGLNQLGPNDPAVSCGTPHGLAATAASITQINLTWTALTNATSYNVKRSTANGGPFSVIATGVTATNYPDSGLAGGTTYYYVLSAEVSGSETQDSPQASAATLPVNQPTIGVWGDNFDSDPIGAYGGVSWNFAGAGVGNPVAYVTNDLPQGTNMHNLAWSFDVSPSQTNGLNFGFVTAVLPATGNTNTSLSSYTINFDLAVRGISLTALTGYLAPSICIFQNGNGLYSGNGEATNPAVNSTFFPAAGTGYQHYSINLGGWAAAAGDSALNPTSANLSFAIGFYMGRPTVTAHEEMDIANLQLTMQTPPPPPHIAQWTVTGGSLVFSGTNGLAGNTYRVLTSTNLAMPLTNWTQVASSNFDGSGNFSVTNHLNTNEPQRFYLLREP